MRGVSVVCWSSLVVLVALLSGGCAPDGDDSDSELAWLARGAFEARDDPTWFDVDGFELSCGSSERGWTPDQASCLAEPERDAAAIAMTSLFLGNGDVLATWWLNAPEGGDEVFTWDRYLPAEPDGEGLGVWQHLRCWPGGDGPPESQDYVGRLPNHPEGDAADCVMVRRVESSFALDGPTKSALTESTES